MTEHESHEAKADEVERELDDMEEQRERLGGEIEHAGEDWQRKQKDERVPGATGEPDDEENDSDDSADVSDEELDFGKDIDSEDVVPEASSADEDDSDDESEDSDR